jgi:hypothetical protein
MYEEREFCLSCGNQLMVEESAVIVFSCYYDEQTNAQGFVNTVRRIKGYKHFWCTMKEELQKNKDMFPFSS